MNKLSKKISVLAAAVLTVSALSVSASAVSSKTTNNGSHGFSVGEWEYSRNVNNGNGKKIGVICYGYDQAWINEDYCWAKSMSGEAKCKAGVYRSGYDGNYVMAGYKSSGSWSKEEVTHKKNTVYYKIQFEASYSNLSLGSESSSWNK